MAIFTRRPLPSKWMQAPGVWAYASATSITVPSDATLTYQVGDKWQLIANGVTLRGYITALTSTVLTVKGDALTNNAFTANYYSRAQSPFGFPTTFDYTTTPGGFSSNPTGLQSRFSLNGNVCTVTINSTNTSTSNATGFTYTAPIVAKTISGMYWYATINEVYDAGIFSTTNDYCYIGSGSSTITLNKNGSATAWTITGAKAARFTLIYEI